MSIDKVIEGIEESIKLYEDKALEHEHQASYLRGHLAAYKAMLGPMQKLATDLILNPDTSFGHIPVTPPLADIEKKEPGTCSHHFGPGTRIGEMVCHNCGFTKQDVFLFREENCPFHAVVNFDGSKGRCMNCGKYA